MKMKLLIASALFFSTVSQAARVAVTDSGTDFSHEWLKSRPLVNTKEVAGNRVDDDRNGKVDDIVGWNFAEDYGKVFYPEHLTSVSDDLFQYFEVIARKQSGVQTAEDEHFWQTHVTDLPVDKKQALLGRLNFYGQYAHSTHVSGIVASLAPKAMIMSNRVFPDSQPEESQKADQAAEVLGLGFGSKKVGLADLFYKLVSAINNGSFEKVGLYLNEQKVDVANYSLGVSLQTLAKLTLSVRGIKNPTAQQLSAETTRAAAQFEPAGQKWMKSSPGTLFVVAAGNDGTNNDLLPVFPANVHAANSIIVAASQGYEKLATFSNYGQSVDIAAPGVAIKSSVPALNHKQILPMSGTSMAAPFITGVAAKAKDLNPRLTAADLKNILMSTVDKKEWLKGKVLSAGVVNPERVYTAATMSNTMPVADAIRSAIQTVKDVEVKAVFGENKEAVHVPSIADWIVF